MNKIEISQKTIIFTVLLLIGLWLIFEIRFVLLLWFIAFLLMTALNPIVTMFERFKLPRILGIIIAFILAISLISLVFAGIIPTFIEQTVLLAKNINQIFPETNIFQIDPSLIASQFETVSQNIVNLLKFVKSGFSNLFAVISIFVLTFYFLLERKSLKNYLKVFFRNHNSEKHAELMIAAIEKRLGGWVRGELALMVIVGFLSYVGLTIIGIPFALPLALLAGLLELVPNIGPIISAIPAIIIGMTISGPVALAVFVLYILVQQLENNVIVPLIMKQSAGINPMITLMVLMVGLSLGEVLGVSVMGAILAIPLYITIEVIFRHIRKHRSAK